MTEQRQGTPQTVTAVEQKDAASKVLVGSAVTKTGSGTSQTVSLTQDTSTFD
ncbi:hypothetical protein AGMMS49592_6130 [Endomicrobiia bacterium]|nr:hypothetical protein AGMMS49592_6130 [Endomicrobiia bacterium]